MSSLRSDLAKVRGLGAAGTGSETFGLHRLTWAALIVLSIGVLILLLMQVGKPYEEVKACFAGFVPTLWLILFVAVTFLHFALELTEVIEDYVHNHALNRLLLLTLKGGFLVLALGSILMILRNFFGA